MKNLALLTTTWIFISACSQPGNQVQERSDSTAITETKTEHQENKAATLRNLFTLTEAEKILGESAALTDSTTNQDAGVLMYKCAFTATTNEIKNDKIAAVYFLAEHYSDTAAAHKKYTSIYTANQNHAGIKVLHDLGDEAYFHSDDENFYFIMVRKGSDVFVMKVNKITPSTSLQAFNEVARQIANRLG